MLTKPLPCQGGNEMNLNMWWPNLSQDKKCISTCVDRTHSMLSRTQNAFQQVLSICQREHKMYLNSCWLYPSHDRENTNVSQHVLTNPLLCQRGHKNHLYMCWPISSNASEDSKCISSCVDQTYSIPARKQNVSQHMLTNPTHASEDTKCMTKPIPWQRGETKL